MSFSLILCEGKSDAIIIGYLMIGYYSWQHKKAIHKNIFDTINVSKNQSFEWYQNQSDYVAICGVGGKFEFNKFINEKVAPFQRDQSYDKTFSKILIVRDRDNDKICTIQDALSNNDLSLKFEANKWIDNTCFDGYQRNYVLKTCLNIIPKNREGALENVILESLSESDDNKKIVETCINFVEKNKEIACRYLSKKRLVEKAKVGVTFAMMSPEKVFDFLDEILKSINWTKHKVVLDAFSELKNI